MLYICNLVKGHLERRQFHKLQVHNKKVWRFQVICTKKNNKEKKKSHDMVSDGILQVL